MVRLHSAPSKGRSTIAATSWTVTGFLTLKNPFRYGGNDSQLTERIKVLNGPLWPWKGPSGSCWSYSWVMRCYRGPRRPLRPEEEDLEIEEAFQSWWNLHYFNLAKMKTLEEAMCSFFNFQIKTDFTVQRSLWTHMSLISNKFFSLAKGERKQEKIINHGILASQSHTPFCYCRGSCMIMNQPLWYKCSPSKVRRVYPSNECGNPDKSNSNHKRKGDIQSERYQHID